MSRAYKIKLANLHLNLHENGKVWVNVELLPILPVAEMKKLLIQALERRGGKHQKNDVIVERENGVRYRFDLEEMKLEISIESALGEKYITVYEEWLPREIQKTAQDGVIEIDEQKLQQLDINVTGRIAEELLQAKKILTRETLASRQFINEALKEVYKEAIVKKAGSLGNVTSMSESERDGQYRIRLEMQ